MRHLVPVALLALVEVGGAGAGACRVSLVVDGITVYLTNDAKIRLVQIDTPEVYDGRRGRFATALVRAAVHARAGRLGLWGAGPRTPVDFDRGVDAGSAQVRQAAG